MTKEQLLQEKENLELRIKFIDDVIKYNEMPADEKQFSFSLSPWETDILWQIADIIRTSPIVNTNYPYGYDCKICRQCGNECTTDGDGQDCNWAFYEYFEKELIKRGYFEV